MTGLGIAFAGGGERLIAWYAGLLAGCAAAGEDLRAAAVVVGTSAGTVPAVQLACGADLDGWCRGLAANARPAPPRSDGAALFDRLAAACAAGPGTPLERRQTLGRLAVRRSPGGEAAFVAAVERRLPAGTRWPAALRVAALDAETGERVAWSAGDGVPLERALAAARSVPLLRPPVRVGGRACVDGALASATNADVLLAARPLDLAVVVTGSPQQAPPGSLDALWNAALADELTALERAGVPSLVLRASDRDRDAMGPDPLSGAQAPAAAAAGHERGAELAAALAQRTRTIAGRR